MSEQQQQQQQEHNRMWLNNYVGRHALGEVKYIEEGVNDGGQHVWRVTVQINGTDVGYGQASTKADAKEMAAKHALAHLKEEATTG